MISAVSSTNFTLATNQNATMNINGATYVAYLFAHDAGGFGDAGSDSIIKCGSYTIPNGPLNVNLGWEPQFLLIKRTDATADWYIMDNMRGFTVADNPVTLIPNSSDAEGGLAKYRITNTGFGGAFDSGDSGTFVYIAIRRGPMKTPTTGTSVFSPTVYTGTNADNRLINTTIAPDMVMIRQRNDTVVPGLYVGARLTGQEFMITGSTDAGATDANSFDAQIVSTTEYGNAFSSMSGVWVGNDATRKFNANTTSNNHVIEAFKRAPGFFDVVCYTGTGANRTVSHNLSVAPELIIVKRRDTTGDWIVYPNNSSESLILNSTSQYGAGYWNATSPTSSVFTVGTSSSVNASGSTYVAYLFASLSGISKVGSYTGNGSSQTINCGFTAGARFVLIKRYDGTTDWFVYDTARGIVSGNDPQLKPNSTDAEATGYDAVDPDNSGFIVNQDATNFPINTNTATYIYLAIA